jgi:hypothetical protein
MQPLTLDDLLQLADFIARRSEFFAAHARYLDRYRRVRIGPKLTLVFENRQTLWFRIHELLRVARLVDPPRVQQELDSYNHLLPGEDTLQAALLIDVPEGPNWAEEMRFWQDLAGEHLRLQVGEVAIDAHLVTCRPEDRCTGAAHWVTFAVTDAARQALADDRQPAFAVARYRTYRHQSAALTQAMRKSLLEDLELPKKRAA